MLINHYIKRSALKCFLVRDPELINFVELSCASVQDDEGFFEVNTLLGVEILK